MWCVIQLLCQQRGRRRGQLPPDPCATHIPFLTRPPSSQLAPTPLVSVLIGKLALAYANWFCSTAEHAHFSTF